MVRQIIFTLLMLNALLLGAASVDTMNGTPCDRVRSLRVINPDDPFGPSVIRLGSGDVLKVNFDVLSEDRDYLRYRLVHCNADWTPSTLVDSEFLDGFNESEISEYRFSQATTVHYINYSLTIPNSDIAPKLSGNYLLQIYPESDPDQIWAQYRFMVSEEKVRISGDVTSRTDVDYNDAHQQLELAVDTRESGVADPFNDLFVVIQQNGRLDNEVALRQPLRMSGTTSVYEHQPRLIFEAGNEYRRMETVSTQFPSMGVESIDYIDPYYYHTLQTDSPRNRTQYLYDQTQHGAYVVREYNSADSDVEADYTVVVFSLDMPYEPDTMIFLDGDFTLRRFDDNARMNYNRERGCYERLMLLKQGAYNYQYLAVPRGAGRGYTAPVEGDRYQTVNRYTVKVYERRPGSRADRLLGVATIGQ
ncbi:MAG: DUF5103 domain-containing protein [Muribaculaceae bacterium]|nr:DUF5103 domain-containing protein [Muribaculaceae bacterium]